MELVTQAAARPWTLGEMQSYRINRLISPYEIPDGTSCDNRTILITRRASAEAPLLKMPSAGLVSNSPVAHGLCSA